MRFGAPSLEPELLDSGLDDKLGYRGARRKLGDHQRSLSEVFRLKHYCALLRRIGDSALGMKE